MNKSESIIELATALALAQTEMTNPEKNKNNPFFKSSYTDLAAMINAYKNHYAQHGLSIVQFPSLINNMVSVETVILHKSGEWISGGLELPISKSDAQGVGAVITYCRRYALAAACNIAQEDSDAELAMDRGSSGKSNNTVHPETKKPWYNEFTHHEKLMVLKIKAGEETADQILSNLRKNYAVSKEIAGKITMLAKYEKSHVPPHDEDDTSVPY